MDASFHRIVCFGTLYVSCLLNPRRRSQLKETLFDIFRLTSLVGIPNMLMVDKLVGGESGFCFSQYMIILTNYRVKELHLSSTPCLTNTRKCILWSYMGEHSLVTFKYEYKQHVHVAYVFN